ncbi:MAG: hypothetical protein K5647_10035 [Clostridiales bacterium]|nr:hypothetical protein [Clostridiales bacterium]
MKAKPPTPKKLLCLILAAAVLLSLAGCGTDPSGAATDAENKRKRGETGEAGLIFAERNDGAYLGAIENPGKYDFLEVTVPETFNGKTVVGCDIGTDYKKCLPQMLTVGGMEKIIELFAETINALADDNKEAKRIDWKDYFKDQPLLMRARAIPDSNNNYWWYLNQFLAYYNLKSLSDCASETESDALLKQYPQCAETAIYVLHDDATDAEYVYHVYLNLKKYAPSYSFDDKLDAEREAGYYQWLVYESECRMRGEPAGREEAEKRWKEITEAGRSAAIPDNPGVITSLSLPDCVEKLTGHLAMGTDLSSFVIPSGVKSIEWDFFIGCRKDMKVTYQGTENWVAVDKNGNNYTFGQLCDSLKNELKLSYGESYKLELKIE